MSIEVKMCRLCKENKDLGEFGVTKKKFNTNFSGRSDDLLDTRCKECKAKLAREWRKANPGYVPTNKVNQYPKSERLLVSAIRKRCSEAKSNNKRYPNREFTINTDYLYSLYKEQEGKCMLTGTTLLITPKHPESLSIDKIIPSLGYTVGNVQWVCWAANRAKGDLTMQQFTNLCEAVLRTCNDYPGRE